MIASKQSLFPLPIINVCPGAKETMINSPCQYVSCNMDMLQVYKLDLAKVYGVIHE